MEVYEILLNMGVGGLAVYMVIRVVGWLNNREKYEADSDARQDSQIIALTTAIQTMATVSATYAEQNQAHIAAFKALTGAITDLKTCEDDTQTMVDGLRREQQTHLAGALERHQALMTALAPLPDIKTGVDDIKETWPRDFKRIGEALSDLKSQNQEQGDRIDAACQEWQTTGTSILMYLEEEQTRRAEGVEGGDQPSGESPVPKPASHEPNTSDGSQSDVASTTQSIAQPQTPTGGVINNG